MPEVHRARDRLHERGRLFGSGDFTQCIDDGAGQRERGQAPRQSEVREHPRTSFSPFIDLQYLSRPGNKQYSDVYPAVHPFGREKGLLFFYQLCHWSIRKATTSAIGGSPSFYTRLSLPITLTPGGPDTFVRSSSSPIASRLFFCVRCLANITDRDALSCRHAETRPWQSRQHGDGRPKRPRFLRYPAGQSRNSRQAQSRK
ncbi:MAG: hypothetical protein JWR80_4426 [Bradyrhizobium sp.]|nr:hypothetical protein [Bradyrhizobium sp.]